MRGRKPKPTTLRRLEGNPGHRALNDDEPAPPPFIAAVPDEIAAFPAAVLEWRRLAPMLQQAKQITEADRGALIALCMEWARYLDAMREVARLGLVVKAPSGYPITNPYLPIATKALAACNKLWPELGLTPSSRSRVKIADPSAARLDDFAEFDAAPPLQ